MGDQIEWSQWKVDPPITKSNAAVPGPLQKVRSQQTAQIIEDLRITCGVQPVAPIVNRNGSALKASRVSAHAVALLDDSNIEPTAQSQAPRSPQPRGAGAQDQNRLWINRT